MFQDKTKVVLVAVIILLAVLGSIFAPAYKSVIKERTTLQEINETLLTRISVQQSEIHRLSSSKATHRIKGSLKEPVEIGGIVAYREAKWEASDTSDVRSAVVDALSSVQSSTQSSSQSVSMDTIKSATIIKRQTVGVGLGYGVGGKKWGLLTGRVIGPLSAWGAASWDKDAIVGASLSFY